MRIVAIIFAAIIGDLAQFLVSSLRLVAILFGQGIGCVDPDGWGGALLGSPTVPPASLLIFPNFFGGLRIFGPRKVRRTINKPRNKYTVPL